MAIQSLTSLLSEELRELDAYLATKSQTKVNMINELSSHIISSGGKRLRPIVLLLSAYSSDSKLKKHVLDACVVVEFIHAATLLHDDVVDMSKIRHSKETANIIWGNKGSVLVGDFLYSRAFEIIVQLDNAGVYETLANTTNIIAQGEVMQLMNIGNVELSEDMYMDIIFRKTAILFQASAKIGGIINGASKKNIEALSTYGLHFGRAYQLRNDYLDYFGDSKSTGKNIIEDLLEGKATLPIIHAMSKSNDEDRIEIKEAFSKADPKVELGIIKILKKYKSDLYIQNKIKEQTEFAIKALENLRPSKYKNELIQLANYCQDRPR